MSRNDSTFCPQIDRMKRRESMEERQTSGGPETKKGNTRRTERRGARPGKFIRLVDKKFRHPALQSKPGVTLRFPSTYWLSRSGNLAHPVQLKKLSSPAESTLPRTSETIFLYKTFLAENARNYLSANNNFSENARNQLFTYGYLWPRTTNICMIVAIRSCSGQCGTLLWICVCQLCRLCCC